jgi:HEAT repeat protein
MSHATAPIKESTLSTDLSEHAHAFVRDLALACRKMSIYSSGHPQAVRAVEKPFFELNGIFHFKLAASLNVARGQLFALNILLRDTVFNAQILQHLQAVDTNAVLFHREMTLDEFSTFVEMVTRRSGSYDPSFVLGQALEKRGISSIQVNSEQAYDLFENRKQYRGDVHGDFSVRRMLLDQLGSELLLLAEIQHAQPSSLLKRGIDFSPSLVDYVLPERLAAIPAADIRQKLADLARQINQQAADSTLKEETTSKYVRLFRLVALHPEHASIVDGLDAEARAGLPQAAEGDSRKSATGAIKIKHTERIDDLMTELLRSGGSCCHSEEFCESFARLLKTGQGTKATEVVEQLLGHLSSSDTGLRQKALSLADAVMGKINMLTDREVLASAVRGVVDRLENHEETYEYSEVIWRLFAVAHTADEFELMARLTAAMVARRSVVDNVTVYDSMAVKKAFENISQPETIQRFIQQIMRANHQQANYIKEILVAIGSESVALALAKIISHPVRPVRQLTLKILAEMGKAALRVYSDIVQNDAMFQRETGRHELPDEKWYVIRNSIFVLGSLEDQDAVPALRSRISDTDIQVRREIIASLEKIGGEDAVDCLTLMADDAVPEIRGAAIIAISIIGGPEHAPLMIDIAKRCPAESAKAMVALGKLGGPEARAYLCRTLDDPKALADLSGGHVSRADLRVALIKARGAIGAGGSIAQIG